jgi:hypothetical protein
VVSANRGPPTAFGPPSVFVENWIGPVSYYGNIAGNSIELANRQASAGFVYTNVTMAALVKPAVIQSVAEFIISASATRQYCARAATTGNFVLGSFGTQANSGFSLANGVHYFVAASCNGSLVNFAIANLETGQVYTAANVSFAGWNNPDDASSYIIGNNGNSLGNTRPFTAAIGPAMFSGAFLSMPQLRQWAADPFAFWYPQAVPLDLSWLTNFPAPVLEYPALSSIPSRRSKPYRWRSL